MKKFTYRTRFEIVGEIVDENEKFYFISANDDLYSWEKELTVIKENAEETVVTKGCKMPTITGVVVRTAQKIYIIQKAGKKDVMVYKLDSDGYWNRYFNVNIETLKGGAPLPTPVKEKIKEMAGV